MKNKKVSKKDFSKTNHARIHTMDKERVYIAIDLKSFYASVECQERGLNPLDTNLVVADESRTEKTICLAVSPSLKQMGVSSRPRLFEVIQKVKEINRERMKNNRYRNFEGSSISGKELQENIQLEVSYIAAVPRMALYQEYSNRIYEIYLKYISAEDIHVYSIDEVFIDATEYLKLYQMNAHDFARKLILEVLRTTGITATAGIATNMFLCKCAMDIIAKHIPADENGVRIAQLDERSYREKLWTHRPLTDFWRIGRGTARKLEEHGLFTMGDIAGCSIGGFHDYYNEDLLYKLFGVNAELIIDHAWGYEPCTMHDVKNYKPQSSSMGIGQVLHKPYTYESAMIIVREMAEALALQMVEKKKMTRTVSLYIGYDRETMESVKYSGDTVVDFYGREMPKPVNGSVSFPFYTDSRDLFVDAFSSVFEKTDHRLLIRRINVTAIEIKEREEADTTLYVQGSLLDSFDEKRIQSRDRHLQQAVDELKSERKVQQAILEIQRRYGKNAVIKGMDKQDDATTLQRNEEIGGHKA